MKLLVSLLEDVQPPKFEPITQFLSTWGLALLSFLAGVAAITAAIFFVIKAFKLMKAEDPAERHAIRQDMAWIVIGFFIAAGGGVIAGVFSASFFNPS